MSVSGTQRRGIVLSAGTVVTSPTVYLTASSPTWYQLIASTSVPILVVSLVVQSASASQLFELGTGAAASEVSVLQLRTISAGQTVSLTYPLRVPAGTRVVARHDSVGAGIYVAIQYVSESAVV